jgi:integrase
VRDKPARQSNRLNNSLIARALKGEADAGKYRDGKNGLILLVRQSGRASWLMRYMFAGRRHDLGLGSLEHVGLSQARDRAAELMGDIKGRRIDPLAERTTLYKQQRLANVTFDQAATAYIEAHKSGWRDKRGEATWRGTLANYASPVIGSRRVGEVDTEAVLKILTPIWSDKPETASRVRGRIESVLDYAKGMGWREGENVARWRGHLANLLPAKGKIAKPEHHAALPLDLLPMTFGKLRAAKRPAAQAVCLALLTAARASEASGALWGEINFATKTWVVPAARTKQNVEQRYPLSHAALELLRERAASSQAGEPRLFATSGTGGPSLTTMLDELREASGDQSATTHGFRSNLDDWAHERTSFPSKLVDRQLGHAVGNRTVAAYRRADLLEARRPMIAEWANFLCSEIREKSLKVA